MTVEKSEFSIVSEKIRKNSENQIEFMYKNTKHRIGGSVAAWLSEKVLRGRGPDARGFESHRRGRIFSKEGTSAGPWMCVYVSSGLTVGWWKEESTLFRPPPRGQHGFESRREGRPRVYKCCCVCL
jgi:hypothetical protein